MARRIGIFGGTFNPVHKGHEATAVRFYGKFRLDELIIMPSNIPPHKQVDAGISAAQRFEMCRLCFGKYSALNIRVSDLELKKGGASYTFYTMSELRQVYAGDKLYFLAGSDMFLYLENWHRYRELLGLCAFAVAFRNEPDRRAVLELRDKLVKTGAEIELLENEPLEVSSTELRAALRAGGGGAEKYISAEVLRYIKEQELYV